MSKKKITVLKLMQSIVAMLLRYLLTKEHHRFRSCSIIPSIIQGKRQLAKKAPRQGAQESAEATTDVYVQNHAAIIPLAQYVGWTQANFGLAFEISTV